MASPSQHIVTTGQGGPTPILYCSIITGSGIKAVDVDKVRIKNWSTDVFCLDYISFLSQEILRKNLNIQPFSQKKKLEFLANVGLNAHRRLQPRAELNGGHIRGICS